MAQPIRATTLAMCILAGAVGVASWLRAAPDTQPAVKPPETRPEEAKPGPETRPADPKPKLDDAIIRSQRQQRDSARNQFAHLKDLGTMKREMLLQVSMNQGFLKLEVTPQATQESQRVKVEGSDAIWAVSRQNPPTIVGNPNVAALRAAQGPTHIIQRVDPDVKSDDEIWSLYVSSNNSYMTLMGTKVSGRVTYHQTGNMITATATEWQQGGRMQTIFTARASSIQQLRSEHPEEFRQHIQPMLLKVSDLAFLRPGPADVYAVFGRIQADLKVIERIQALLTDLDSPAFPIRDSASSRLEALGAAGVLAALRLDPSILTDEQRGRLGAFINRNRNRTFDDPAAARKDVNFLIDALEYEDAAVRTAARDELEGIVGHAVKFDASLTGDALSAAIDGLRKEAAATPAPTTQPATKPVQ